MAVAVRLLPPQVADGAWNMAADEVLLQSAVAGQASLRFYGWTEATLSLGYFQPAVSARAYPGLAGLPWIRRPTGGAALVHHHELTYALAIPAGAAWQPPGRPWLVRMHALVRDVLARLGVSSTLAQEESRRGEVLCFLHHTLGDLIVAGHKVAGSAQRRQHGALLQHGGILLAQSPHTPELPGINDLGGHPISAEQLQNTLLMALRHDLGCAIHADPWSAEEQEQITQRIASRYRCPDWNERR